MPTVAAVEMLAPVLALAAEVVASPVVFIAVDAVAAGPGVTAVPLRAQAPSFNVPAVRCRYEGRSYRRDYLHRRLRTAWRSRAGSCPSGKVCHNRPCCLTPRCRHQCSGRGLGMHECSSDDQRRIRGRRGTSGR